MWETKTGRTRPSGPECDHRLSGRQSFPWGPGPFPNDRPRETEPGRGNESCDPSNSLQTRSDHSTDPITEGEGYGEGQDPVLFLWDFRLFTK